jgi:hypothetical protein
MRNFESNFTLLGSLIQLPGYCKAMLDWKDLVAICVIVFISYWLAFRSGLSKLFSFTYKKNNKPRGNICGDPKSNLTQDDYIKTVPGFLRN